ncbi:MAG: hypothetical protein WA047_07705 [Phenylobacterium sp.]|uniref:hypothetical protein n=1 Tax=Phenylobacterium sp. TaxID=1871053 RepID=UPI003BB741B3
MTKIHDLDHWAEDRFALLCAEAGVTRNRATQDREGWDYVVEISPPKTPGLPADLRSPPQTAWVQVKSKQAGRPATRLKLSNALRFACDPAACFVVQFVATNGGHPVRIFARHVWTEMMEDILRRARQADADERDDLHKLYQPVTFRPEDDHTDDLLAWLVATLRAIPGSYADAKGRILQQAGMADGSFFGSFSFRAEDLPTLVDHQLGLTDAAPIAGVTIRHRRFGIEARIPLVSAKPDFASMRVHPLPGRVRLRRAGFPDIGLEAELRLANLPDLPPELKKTRVTADFLDCVTVEGKGSVNISFSLDEPRTLSSNRALLDTLAMFDAGPVDMSVYLGGGVLTVAALNLPAAAQAWAQPQLSARLACLEPIAKYSAPADLAVSLRELDAAGGVGLLCLSDLMTGKALTAHLTCGGPIGDVSGITRFLAYASAEVGAWTFMALVSRPVVQVRVDGDTLTMVCGNPNIEEGMVRRGSAAEHRASLVSLYSASVKQLGGAALELCGGDFATLQASPGGQ